MPDESSDKPTSAGAGEADSTLPEAPRGSPQVLPSSRWHALVSRAKRLADIDALLAHPSAASLIQGMPAQDLYHAIRQVGIGDCQELIELCHPRQIQTFLDLDGWRRDRVDMARLFPWMEALFAGGYEHISDAIVSLDPEVWVLVMQPNARVHDWSEDAMDGFGDEQVVLQSPDNLYLIEIFDPLSKGGELVQRLCTHLFKVDTPDVWRRLFEASRSEIPAELEEEAYRYRRGRLADLGFVEHHEAAEVFAFLDPVAQKRGGPPSHSMLEAGVPPLSEGATLPAPYARSLGDDSFFVRTLARVDDDDVVESLSHQIVALANRVMLVDDVDIGEHEEVQAAVARVRNYLSIGLEYLSDGDPIGAELYLRGRALRELHRIGFSQTLLLKRRASALFHSGWLSRPGARLALLDPEERELLAGLRRRRPLFYGGLTDAARVDFREFDSLLDVERVGEALERIELQGWLFLEVLKLDPAVTPPALAFSSLVRSAVVHQATGGGFRFDPVTADELTRFLQSELHLTGDVRTLSDDVREETTLYLEGVVTDRGPSARAAARSLSARWLATLESELCGLDATQAIDVRFVGGLWLVGQTSG